MISDFLPSAITVTNAGGGGGKTEEAADHRLCLSEEQICNCCRKPRLRPRHHRNIPEKCAGHPSAVGWRWSVFALPSEH